MGIGLMPVPSGKIRLAVDVDPDFRQRLKLLATAMEITMGELLTRLVSGGESIEDLEAQYLQGGKQND